MRRHQKLFAARQQRVHPSRDEKVLTAWNGLMLAAFSNDLHHVDISHQGLARMQPMKAQYPLGFGPWLRALAYALSKPREIAMVGDSDAADTQALLDIARGGYRPFHAVALGAPDAQPPAVPLLQDRGLVNGQAAAYVCRGSVCQAPVEEPEGLREQLDRR